MALIGSGSKDIQNHAADASLSAGKLDQSLEAVVEQVGGVGWSAGAPVLHPGNMDTANFASGMQLPNKFKLEPRSTFVFPVCEAGALLDSSVPNAVMGASACPVGGQLVSVTFGQSSWGTAGVGTWTGGTFRFSFTVNGLLVGKSEEIGHSDFGGAHVVKLGLQVRPGDVIGASRTDITGTGNSGTMTNPVRFVATVTVDHA